MHVLKYWMGDTRRVSRAIARLRKVPSLEKGFKPLLYVVVNIHWNVKISAELVRPPEICPQKVKKLRTKNEKFAQIARK
jgi:hypothetical protein